MIVSTNSDFDFSTILDTAKWDWTRASITYQHDEDRAVILGEIVQFMKDNYGDPELHEVNWSHESLPDNSNYENVKLFKNGTQDLFTVSRGRSHIGKFIQVEASGSRASIGRKIIKRIADIKRPDADKKGIKSHPFEVRVTRSDSCIDLCGDPELFDTLIGFFDAFCKENNIVCEPRGHGWHNPSKGRTMYYGSKSSDYYLRIYQKGHEQRDRGVEDADLTWVRIEVQVQYKATLQRLAVGAWDSPSSGFQVGWIKKAFSNLLMTDILGVYMPSSYKPQTDTERSIYNMFKRSRKALRLLAMQYDTQEDFAKKILQEIDYSYDIEVNLND